MKIYICKTESRTRILRFLHIKHNFIITEKGNRYEVQRINGRIKIRHKHQDLNEILKKVDYKIINLSLKEFIKKRKAAIKLYHGKQYRLFIRDCKTFVDFFKN